MKRGSGWSIAAAAVVVGLASATASWAAGQPAVAVTTPATELAPHRAVYAMSLASTRPGSGIAGASGTMTYEFADSCDGWVVENRIAITYAYTEGAQVMSATDFITWEAKDGLSYRFRMRQSRDGQITEEIEGTAKLKGKGKGGSAHFIRPEDRTIPLPQGTLFPTQHTARLLDTAQEGGKLFWRVVFDGSGTEGPFEVNAMIGRPSTPQPAATASPLTDVRSWPMRMAFFPVASKDPLPDFEMALDYHTNGVAREILQSFSNFSLKGQLQSIEALPKRRC